MPLSCERQVAADDTGDRIERKRFIGDVNSPIAGYAISPVLQVAMGVSRNQQAEQAMRVWDTHWLKDEYRIPPLGKVDAVASLNGFPALPMTVRVTVGARVFIFDSVRTF